MKILSLSGLIPEQIVDTERFIQYRGNIRISHYCGYAADYISRVLKDASIDGAVMPKSCDSCRILPGYLAESGKFIHQLNVPARQDNAAIDFFASNIKTYKNAVYEHYAISVNIAERADLINKRNRELSALYDNLADISYTAYLEQIHKLLATPLARQKVMPVKGLTGSKTAVYIIGSLMPNIAVIETIENSFNIAGDNLTQSKRLFSAPPVNSKDDIYREISASILRGALSPTQNNFSDIIKMDLEEIKKKTAKGVIFITQKYCEAYDYLFLSCNRMLMENNIPSLRLVLSDTTDNKQIKLAVEAFADILDGS